LLDPQHEAFVQNLRKGHGQNAAYRMAGLKPYSGAAFSLRYRPNTVRRLDYLARQDQEREETAKQLAQDKAGVTADRVISEMAALAFVNMKDFVKLDAAGDPFFDYDSLSRVQAGCIQEVTIDTFKDSRGETCKRLRLKLVNKLDALTRLGKHLGLFVDPAHLNINVANYFSEKPPTLQEWKQEIDLIARASKPVAENLPRRARRRLASPGGQAIRKRGKATPSDKDVTR
jgi:phage terminase small subunit